MTFTSYHESVFHPICSQAESSIPEVCNSSVDPLFFLWEAENLVGPRSWELGDLSCNPSSGTYQEQLCFMLKVHVEELE